MAYLISQFGLWMLLALILGAVVGWLTFHGERGGWLVGWFKWAFVACLIGLAVAMLRLLPGRYGLYLETALLLFASYIVGGHIGAWLNHFAFGARGAAVIGAAGVTAAASSSPARAAPVSLKVAEPILKPPVAAPVVAPAAPAAVSSAAAAGPAPLAPIVGASSKPALLDAARGGQADDLMQIAGLDAATETKLHRLGIFHIDQLAELTPQERHWLDGELAKEGLSMPAHWADAAAKLAVTPIHADHAPAIQPVVVAESSKPELLDAARYGQADDLTKLAGLDAATEAKLNRLGIFHFDQLAAMSPEEQNWLAAELVHPGAALPAGWAAASAGLAQGMVSTPPASTPQPSPAAAEPAVAKPAAAEPVVAAASKPALLDAAHNGLADDLTQIAGLDAATEAKLNRLGIFHFDQLAQLAPTEQAWLAAELTHPGAALPPGWATQAATLAKAQASAPPAAKAPAASEPSKAEPADAAMEPAHQHRPAAVTLAKDDAGDNLKLIKGIGPRNESILNALGIHQFTQIAVWNADEQRWVGQNMTFPGRVEREHWVEQARLLSAGIETSHATAVLSGQIIVDETADAPLDDAAIAEMQAAMPKVAAGVEGEDKHGGRRPIGLAAPRGGKADDLKRIRGIGPQNESRLHNLGIFHFDQIAAWKPDQVQWVGSYLAFPGRIDREEWISQAKMLAQGKATAFSKRVDAGEVPTSKGG